MSLTSLVTTAAESAEHGINPWFVGGGVLVALLVLLSVLLAFAGGRDHS